MFTWKHSKSSFSEDEVREHLKKCVNLMGYRVLGRLLGVSHTYMQEVVKGTRPPGPKILKALQLRRAVVYLPIEEQECIETSAS